MKRLPSIAAVLVLLPARALGWGPEGHQTIADLADRHLIPAAAAAVADLLGSASMADVALWADDIKREQRPETRPWHYVSIPDASAGFDGRRDCPGRACVVDKIVDFAAVLKSPGATRPQRVEALKFLIHYVADLHQPLHCEDHGDTLSHGIAAHYPKLGLTDFHVVWDTGVVQTDMGARSPAANALALDRDASRGRVEWSAGTPADWANESHRIAQAIYLELPAHRPPGPLELTDAYGRAHAAIVEKQLERAGIRLAAILNEAFGPLAERPAR